MSIGRVLALDFADQVRELLVERRMTHADLASLVRIDRAIVSRTLRGTHRPELGTVRAYARALDCDVVMYTVPFELVLVPRSPAPAEAA